MSNYNPFALIIAVAAVAAASVLNIDSTSLTSSHGFGSGICTFDPKSNANVALYWVRIT